MSYTYENWLKMHPEPISGSDNYQTNEEFAELKKIKEAKEYTFNTSFRLTVEFYREKFSNELVELDLIEKIDFTKEVIKISNEAIGQFKKTALITQKHPEKYIGIQAYHFEITQAQERGEHYGVYGTYLNKINEFHFAVIHYNLLKTYLEYLKGISPNENSSAIPELTQDGENEKDIEIVKGEFSGVRYLLLSHFFDENPTFKSLSQGQKEKFLGYILGIGTRTAKGLKNGEPKYLKKDHIERYKELLDKIIKGDIL